MTASSLEKKKTKKNKQTNKKRIKTNKQTKGEMDIKF